MRLDGNQPTVINTVSSNHWIMSPPSSMSSSQRELAIEQRNGAKSRIKAKEDDLLLFNEMLMKENDDFLLCSADELEDSLSKLKYFPDFKSNFAAEGSSSDLLNTDCEKNDYEWLLTPPETPLFPSLDDENPKEAKPKKLSTSNPRSSTPPVQRTSSITPRKANRGSSPSPKLHKSQPKSFSDRPPSRTRDFSPVLRRNSASPTGSISFSSSHCQDQDSSSNHGKSSIISSGDEKNERFSDAVHVRSEDHHGTSEDIFRTIMSSIPGRTLSGEEGIIDIDHSISSTITSSDGSSNGMDDRSEKMQDIDHHQDMFQLDAMESVAAIEDEINTCTAQKIHEELEVVASVSFSDVSTILEAPIISENSQKLENVDGDVDFFQIDEGKDQITSDFQPLHANVDESCERSDAGKSSPEVASTALTATIEVKTSPLLQIENGLDKFSTFSIIGSHHRRTHSFSSYTRINDSERVSFLKRSNNDKGSLDQDKPLFVDIAPTEKPLSSTVNLTSIPQNKESPKSQFHVDLSSSLLENTMNRSEAEVDSSSELSSLKPHGTLVNRIDNNLGDSLDDERLSSLVNPGDVSQDSSCGISEHEHADDNFISLPVEREASQCLSSTSGSSHGIVLLELMKGESEKKTKCLTLEEATDTILFCSSIVHDLAFQASSIAMEKEETQSDEKSTSEMTEKSTPDENSTPEMNGKIRKISPLIDNPPEKAVRKKPLKGESPKMCSCTVM